MQRGTFKVTTAPASEPLTLNEAKAHLRVDFDAEDTYITTLISVARDYAEKFLLRAILPQTITHILPCWPAWELRNRFRAVQLYRPPLIALLTVKYYDTDNTQQTLYISTGGSPVTDTVIILSTKEPPEIVPAYDTEWPSHADRPDAIEIKYTAGWATAADVPTTIKQAMLLIIGELYERRENSVKQLPTAAEHLLGMHAVRLW